MEGGLPPIPPPPTGSALAWRCAMGNIAIFMHLIKLGCCACCVKHHICFLFWRKHLFMYNGSRLDAVTLWIVIPLWHGNWESRCKTLQLLSISEKVTLFNLADTFCYLHSSFSVALMLSLFLPATNTVQCNVFAGEPWTTNVIRGT